MALLANNAALLLLALGVLMALGAVIAVVGLMADPTSKKKKPGV